jgi:transcriptional regulator with XRE-family HTH domain
MDKIREWLNLTGKSPADLARLIGTSENSVRNWLAGRNSPGGIHIRRLHEQTSIPLEDIVPREDAADDRLMA